MTKLAAAPEVPPAPRPGRDDRTSLLLAAHHADVERVCLGLLADTLADDPRGLIECWRWFERAVLEHMAAEEELILPGYAVADPRDACAVVDDHARLRVLMAALGLEVELHVIRATTVRALVDAMHAHAAHETLGMYRWAGRHLSPPVRAALQARLTLNR